MKYHKFFLICWKVYSHSFCFIWLKTLSTQIINTEWGAFSSNLPLTVFDKDMDIASINPGEQVNHLFRLFLGLYIVGF